MKAPPVKRNIAAEYGITGKEGKPIAIPQKGSLGLLALGYRGLMAWRAKRIEQSKQKNKKTNR
jgi:hypothetical protein